MEVLASFSSAAAASFSDSRDQVVSVSAAASSAIGSKQSYVYVVSVVYASSTFRFVGIGGEIASGRYRR